ncbi:hypothetical protein BDZ91DRAFT_217215 [Kalaharituber pfeilii]|nr:hypothetical protein BDZ91DRAFT_217215 [Kalaharituber pfeilii]
MVSRVLHRFANRRLLATSAILAGAGAAASANGPSKFSDEADAMFRKSSIYPVPLGWTGRVWEIRNDYPGMPGIHKLTSGAGKEGMEIAKRDIMLPPMPPTTPLPPTIPLPPTMPLPPKDDAPWMNYDFKTQPESYCTVIKDYCWEGNENNEFVVQKNTVGPSTILLVEFTFMSTVKSPWQNGASLVGTEI